MTRYFAFGRRAWAALAVLAAVACSGQVALAQYTFVQADSAGVAWFVPENWDPEEVPTGADVSVLFNTPLTTAPGGSGFTINLPEMANARVGSFTVDHTNFDNAYVNRINTNGGRLIFETTSGPATYTEIGSQVPPAANGRFVINAGILLLTDLIVTQDNQPQLNTSTEFSGLIDGASDLTFTKEGTGNLQLSYGFPLGEGEGFEGQFVINEGGIRLINAPGISKSSGVTVNPGGQLQLGRTGAFHIPDWNLADGAVLNLNGSGKAVGAAQDGALRFQLSGGVTSSFHNPVNLQSDATIAVNPAGNTGVLTGPVSGEGGLIKSGAGDLVLTSAVSSYTGDTSVLNGTLQLTNPILPDGADVHLSSDALLDLNFVGTNVINSLFIDGAAQLPGLWGAISNEFADHHSDQIMGAGMLQVTTVPGLPGDYNNDSIVDAADYVLWRKENINGSQGYDDWRSNFGQSNLGSGSSMGALAQAVPEPGALALVVLSMPLVLVMRRRQRV